MSASGAPQANPAALGLVGFGLTTVLLSLVNAGLLPAGGEPVVLPLAMAFGGTAQIIAGIMEYKVANTFGARWFDTLCRDRGLDPEATFHERVSRHFKGRIKPPFNREARDRAGFPARYSEGLAG